MSSVHAGPAGECSWRHHFEDVTLYCRDTGGPTRLRPVDRSHGRTDGLTKMNSPSDIDSRNATPAGGQNESINSSPVHGPRPAWIEGWPKVAGYCPACGTSSLFLGSGGWVTCSLDKCPDPTAVADLIEHRPDLSVPAPQPNPSNDEACDHDPGSVAQSAAHRETDKRRLQRPSKVAEGEGSSPSRSTARVDLDLDQIEARHVDNGGGYCTGCGLARGGGWRVESKDCAVRALVAEVRRLRGVADAALAELDRSLEARDRRAEAECDAARAEAERLRERTHEIADEANRRYAPYVSRCAEFDNQIAAAREHFSRYAFPEPFSGVPRTWWDMTSQYNRLALMEIIGQRDAAVAEAARVREALQAIRDLHERTELNRSTAYCAHCAPPFGWPCPTVRALDAALDGSEASE